MDVFSLSTNSSAKKKSKKSISNPLIALKRKRKHVTECTACSRHCDAEVIHPRLKVPICGACNVAVKNRDKFVFEKNEVSCIWCGQSDGNELLMCDTCIHAFCTSCTLRNFGEKETDEIRALEFWSCFLCSPTDSFRKVQENHQGILHSLEMVYSSIRPPVEFARERMPQELVESLTAGEESFACLFCTDVKTSQFQQLDIISYLSGPDLVGTLFTLSKNLRRFFRHKALFLPGLFQTAYGKEFNCKLHFHQQTSLHAMLEIENRTDEFGALRGGIFADEPGLGKTVTVLALISTTIGQLPNRPASFWDKAQLETQWQATEASSRTKLVLPLLNQLIKQAACYGRVDPLLLLRNKSLEQALTGLAKFEQAVKTAVRELLVSDHNKRQLLDSFDHSMNGIKEGLDVRQRHVTKSLKLSRMHYERSLYSSAATLIIVPLALLEHWYEQIMRHLNLRYFSRDGHMRGIVYLDGLGDIVDVEAPISRLSLTQTTSNKLATSPQLLASYSIVVTTIERCVLEQKLGLLNAKASSNLQQVRWLRLVVDEGHDLGRLKYDQPAAAPGTSSNPAASSVGSAKDHFLATNYISRLAAERRWVMSGTPTTGAFSEIGLLQLFQLLCFLRHPAHFTDHEAASLERHEKQWIAEVVRPCLEQDPAAWERVQRILREVLVRHTKDDVELFSPIFSNINLLPFCLPEDQQQENRRVLADDRAKAKFIVDSLREAQRKYQATLRSQRSSLSLARLAASSASSPLPAPALPSSPPPVKFLRDKQFAALSAADQEFLANSRRPKAIVFSQYPADLQGVGHFLYLMLGDAAVCEHVGVYQSSELSRFRHSKRKFRCCPLCGHRNPITAEKFCEKVLYLVEYLHPPALDDLPEGQPLPEPSPSGHGAAGPGGHFVGRCLCSPIGCLGPCDGFVNPLYGYHIGLNMVNPHLALVAEEQVVGWQPGAQLTIGQTIFVQHAEPVPPADNGNPSGLLWRDGRLGGQAVVRAWRKCGGNNLSTSWHGPRVLQQVAWRTEEEDTLVLLLQEEGSTGLDLSFATHIFLLERVQDPALRNQIISRAHRVGATGPVLVQLLQVVAEEIAPEKLSHPHVIVDDQDENLPLYFHEE